MTYGIESNLFPESEAEYCNTNLCPYGVGLNMYRGQRCLVEGTHMCVCVCKIKKRKMVKTIQYGPS